MTPSRGTSFRYIDWITQQISDVYDVERERWLEYRNSLRAVRVHELLDNDDAADIDVASTALGYSLRGRHLALIPWMEDAARHGSALLELERFIRAVAEGLELRRSPLFVAEDRVSGWAWLSLESQPPTRCQPSANWRRHPTAASAWPSGRPTPDWPVSAGRTGGLVMPAPSPHRATPPLPSSCCCIRTRCATGSLGLSSDAGGRSFKTSEFQNDAQSRIHSAQLLEG